MSDKNEISSRRIKTYQRIKLLLSIVSSLFTAGILILLLVTHWSSDIYLLTHEISDAPFLRFVVYATCIASLVGIVNLVFSISSELLLERRYGLSNQSLSQWMMQQAKGLLVGGVIGLPVLSIFYWCFITYNTFWWLPLGAILFLFSVLLARIAPLIIFPLFYTFTSIEASSLRDKIEALCSKQGVKFDGIFSFNMSKESKKANAAFTGIGKAKRILLADTLLQSFTEDEIVSVFAHELGHYKHRHVLKGMLLGAVHLFAMLFISSKLFSWLLLQAGFTQETFVPALPLLALSLSAIGLLSSPIFHAVSRNHERQADAFAAQISNDPHTFIAALSRLADMNLADRAPHPLVEFFFHSHPSIQKRIAFIQRFSVSQS